MYYQKTITMCPCFVILVCLLVIGVVHELRERRKV